MRAHRNGAVVYTVTLSVIVVLNRRHAHVSPVACPRGEQPFSLLPRRLDTHSRSAYFAWCREATRMAGGTGGSRCWFPYCYHGLADADWTGRERDAERLCLCLTAGDVDRLECDVVVQCDRPLGQVRSVPPLDDLQRAARQTHSALADCL